VNDFFELINDDEYSDVVFVFESAVDGRGRGADDAATPKREKELAHRHKRDSRERPREIRAHRNILYARCEQLKEMIEGPTAADAAIRGKKTKKKKKGKRKVSTATKGREDEEEEEERERENRQRRLRRVKIRGIEYDVFYQLVVYLYTSELRLRDPPDEHVLVPHLALLTPLSHPHPPA
jgi:hypothetical protein